MVISELVHEVKSLKQKVEVLADNRAAVTSRRRILNTGQVSMMLDKTPLTIYRMVKKGQLTAYKKGKELFFFEDEVLKTLTESKISSHA